MPKFPGFGRRKSAGNVLENALDKPVAEPSFKVFERPDGHSRSFDGATGFKKLGDVPRAKTAPEENMFEGLANTSRGSGVSSSKTASTTDDSSRFSATSTAMSSTDASISDDWRSPHDMPFKDIPVPRVPKSAAPSLLTGRTFSWGKSRSGNAPPPVPSKNSPATEEEEKTGRARTVTASSSASTAIPPKLEEQDLDLSLGTDFSDMFAGFGKRKSQILGSESAGPASRSASLPPSQPTPRSFSSGQLNPPSPLNLNTGGEIEPPLHSWDSQHSRDGLMSNSGPAPIAARNGEHNPALLQRRPVTNNIDSLPSSKTQRPGGIADTSLRRSSAYHGRRKSSFEQKYPAADEDARLIREYTSVYGRLAALESKDRVQETSALRSNKHYNTEKPSVPSMNEGAADVTPRATKLELSEQEDGIFDTTMIDSANLAQQLEEKAISPPPENISQNKVMTPAQFERYRQDQERLRSAGGNGKEEGDDDEDNYEDDEDEDEAEKKKQLAKQRLKQEAHLSVYRQQMMKVTGENTPALGNLRPGGSASQSSPSLMIPSLPEDKEDEDEDIPLAILQAHGFPNKNRPPLRSVGSNPSLRIQSIQGGADGRLPVFARNLPQDPYFGAGITYPTNRESMGFAGGARSVHGAPTRGVPAGGLVGIIASEERSRAMRRGSPKVIGGFKPPGANGFDSMGIPPTFQPNMMNGMGSMNPAMLSPGDQVQLQMSQQMQQFMQMQMQFMQMMASGQAPVSQNGMAPQQLPSGFAQPGGPQSRPGSSHQRPITVLETNPAPWLQQGVLPAPSVNGQGGYTPSIAPSERSNIGLPGRYRPVSQIPAPDNKSRNSTVGVASQGTEKNKLSISTNKKPEDASDEDDEEGWEEMAKKREKKKSLWRSKKDTNEMASVLSYT